MTRYRLLLEYDGQGFVGWQRQANGLGVQHALEDAVQAFCGEVRVVFGAGRTDAGVHALGQVAHVDIARTPAPTADTVRDALNFHLRDRAVCVLEATQAATGFHARFSAVARHYRYRILNRRPPPVLRRGHVWWVPQPLDSDAMAEGAAHFVGTHDFTTFRAVLCQARSPVRTLDRLDVRRVDDEIIIEASARSFLHHQVRNMAGTLKLVGEGRWSPADITRAMAARDRTVGGPTAPPEGLCLVGVDYPDAEANDAAGCRAGSNCDDTPAAL